MRYIYTFTGLVAFACLVACIWTANNSLSERLGFTSGSLILITFFGRSMYIDDERRRYVEWSRRPPLK